MRFEPLGLAQGLDVKVVPSLLVDRHGFLWAATWEGLYRYDGYEARRMPSGIASDSALPESELRVLYEDRAGSLWIATNTAGLSRYDPRTGKFQHFRHNSNDPNTLSHDSIYGMAEDTAGNLWVGSQIGLNRLDPQSGRVTRFLHDPQDRHSLSGDYAYAVMADRTGAIWVGTVGGGINIRHPGERGFERIDLAAGLKGPQGLNDIFALAQGRDGLVYAGTRTGLVVIDPDTRQLHREELSAEVGPTLIMDLEWGPKGRLWMATMSKGVLILDLVAGEVIQASAGSADKSQQLPVLPQMSLASRGDQIFVGSWGSGVYLGRYAEEQFALIDADWEEVGLRNRNVTALYVDAGQTAWAGTFGGGLQPLQSDENRVGALALEPPALSSDAVLDIQQRRDGSLALATSHGLWLLQQGGQLWEFVDSESAKGLGKGYVTSVVEDEQGVLWVGVGGSGLYRLAPGSDMFEAFTHDPESKHSLSGNYISDLLPLGDGLLVIGTRSSGLNLCRTDSWRCQRYGAGQELGHASVTSLFAGEDGNVWVGTNGGGLLQFSINGDSELQLIRRWRERDGLLSNSVMGILQDDDGSLWLSSRKGLSRLQPDTATVMNYVGQNGLPASHFTARAAARSDDFLFFGALGGIVKIAAGTSLGAREPSAVRLVELSQADGENRHSTRPAYALDSYSTEWGVPLTVSYATLDFADADHEYQYRLSDSDPWQSLGSRRYLTLLGLAPGKHQLRVRGRDVFGNWSETPSMSLEVQPPFWMTASFRISVVLLIVLLAWAWHRVRMTALRRRNTVLEQLQTEKQQALERAERSQADLVQAHSGLRSLTSRLQTDREEQRQQIARELHDELGQTLTAAKISLQRLRKSKKSEQAPELLDASIGMMDGMIAQVRNISLSLRPPLLDEAGLAEALRVHLDSVAERAAIRIEFDTDGEVVHTGGDLRTVTFRLVQEAVSNTLRHANASRIGVFIRHHNSQLCLEVRDDGCGFDPEQVWERVRRGEHLGLLGMLERARAAGGEMNFESEPGGGCRVTAIFPL